MMKKRRAKAWERPLLDRLREGATIGQASKDVGITSNYVYQLRSTDPRFRLSSDQAISEYHDRITRLTASSATVEATRLARTLNEVSELGENDEGLSAGIEFMGVRRAALDGILKVHALHSHAISRAERRMDQARAEISSSDQAQEIDVVAARTEALKIYRQARDLGIAEGNASAVIQAQRMIDSITNIHSAPPLDERQIAERLIEAEGDILSAEDLQKKAEDPDAPDS